MISTVAAACLLSKCTMRFRYHLLEHNLRLESSKHTRRKNHCSTCAKLQART